MKVVQFSAMLVLCAMTMVVSTACKKESQSGDIIIVFKQSSGEPLAQVGSTTLTVEEMRTDFLERQGQFKGAPNLNTEKARNDYIENQVIQEGLFKAAIEAKYFDRLDVRRDIKKIVVQKFMRDKLEDAQETYVPTEEQMQEHYKLHQNLYNRDEAVRVAFISIPFGEKKAKSKELATEMHKDALNTVKNGNTKDFGRLALKHSENVTKVGRISIETNQTDYLEKPGFEAKFGVGSFEPIKNMEAMGTIGPLVTTENAFVIMMKTGARKALNESFEDAKPKISKRLAFENRGEVYKRYIEELKKKYNIKIFQERVADLSKGAENIAKKELVAEQNNNDANKAGEPKGEVAKPQQENGTENKQ